MAEIEKLTIEIDQWGILQMKGKRIGFFCGILILCLLVIHCVSQGIAEEYDNSVSVINHGLYKSCSVPGQSYELPKVSNYDYTDTSPIESFTYGANSMGKLSISAALEKETVYNDYFALGATGELLVSYEYDGAYRHTQPEDWHVEADKTRWIRGYDVGFLDNIGYGCVMMEKSPDGKTWEKVIEPIEDYFEKEKLGGESLLYRIPESDYKNGMYYKIVVAYRFCRRIDTSFLGLTDEYDSIKCVEVYEFFVASENNYVTVRDMGNGSALTDQSSTDAGFIIRKNGSLNVVTVQGKENECQDFDYFVEPGEYSIEVTTTLGKEYSQTITVTNGLNFTVLEPKAYESEKDKGFLLTTPVDRPVFDSYLTSLSLATPKGFDVKQYGSRYGITGDSISLYLKLNQESDDLGSGWKLNADNWGKKKNQRVNGVETGEVGQGALIVQTSGDGENWYNVDYGRYENGLYTTDYAFHYGRAENVLIYTPSGQEVINGVYIRVLFAYQVNLASQKEYRDYVEEYQLYLCSNELGAVTFHNLSVSDTLDESFIDADQNTVEVYKQAESLEDGAYTVTGFKIDNKLNPTVKYDILRNGKIISAALDTCKVTGKYNITLTSAVGSTRDITIYVDRLNPEEAMEQYFGEGFISGKRIFSEGEYPVYEGGEFSYYIAAVASDILPLYGQIRNMTTGSVITIEQNHDEKTGIISEPGIYEAVFATSEKAFTGELVGDARVFTFRFQVIQQGTAPGPVVNQKMLADYSRSTVTDCNPVYYGLTYSSAGKGNITLAFATKEAAVEYAYNYEKGTVERQENGGYRYTGSFLVGQKIKFDSTWDLTDAVNYFAEAAVQKHFFDMSDEFTYLSMTEEDLEKYPNLRQLELGRSITIFADDQKEKLSGIETLPLLNDKIYAYFDPETGDVDRGFYSFEFVTDQYGGIDSNSVKITDSEGGQHSILYSESVGQQLLADNCPSGIVTVREETMYGDYTEYPAVYIAPGDNTTYLTLTHKHGEDTETSTYTASDNGSEITADNFKIAGLNDPLDPYALVIVKHKQYEVAYTANDTIDITWSDSGKYSITCVNRMGYGYTVLLTVEGTDAAATDDSTINALDPDYAIDYKSQQTSSANTNDNQVASTANPEKQEIDTVIEQPDEQKTDTIIEQPEDQKTKGNTILIIIGILAGFGLIAGLTIFIIMRIRLFSRVSERMKSEGDNNHE